MLDEANEVETQTETNVTETPAAQPDNQGSDSPSQTSEPAAGSAQQAQGAQQQPPSIPKWRFDEVNHRAQAAEARLRELMAQSQQPQQQPAAPQAPKPEDFPTYEEFIRADARFVAQQEAKQAYAAERQREQQASQQQTEQAREHAANLNWSQKTIEAAQKYPDFYEKLSAAPMLHPILQAVLKPSQAAGDLAYHLAGQPETIARLNSMHPLDAIAELGRIEGKLQGSSGQAPTKVSQMPKPMAPVSTGKAGGSKETGINRALSLLYPS